MRMFGDRIALVLCVAALLGCESLCSSQAQTAGAPPAQAGAASTVGGDCCNAAAQNKLASTLGFVDIVGIKLGMTPSQVTAALKANSPTLGFKIFTTRLIMPSTDPAFVKVPHYIVAHKSPSPAADHSQEYIIIEFTLPPNPAVVDRVYRRVMFADGKGVANGTLVSALEKKYGTETNINANSYHWMFMNSGQPVTKPLGGNSAACAFVNGNQDGSFANPPVNDNNSSTEYGDQPITLQYMSQPDNSDIAPACDAYVSLEGTTISVNYSDPSSVALGMTVAMQSAELIHNNRVSTRAWLQADLDAKNNKIKQNGAQQAAPKL
jgi:hypothetical protein